MCLEGTERGVGSAEMILKCWSQSDTPNGPTCTLQEMTRLHQLDRQRSRRGRHRDTSRRIGTAFRFRETEVPTTPRTDTRIPQTLGQTLRCPLDAP